MAGRTWKVLLQDRHEQEADAPEYRAGDSIVLARHGAPPIIAKVVQVLPPTDGEAGTLIVELYENLASH